MKSTVLKRIICALVVSAMAISMIPTVTSAVSNPFVDVKEKSWYSDEVAYVYEKGLMYGVTDTHFDPNGITTRAMVVGVLHRLEGSPKVSSKGFSDVKNGRWYYEAVMWAQKNNIVSGYTDTQFAPNNPMTREEMVAVFYRYAKFKGYDVSKTANASFSDFNYTHSYAKTAVKWAVAVGLISGFSDNTVQPRGQCTRAQLATVLKCFDGIFSEQPADDEQADYVILTDGLPDITVTDEASALKAVSSVASSLGISDVSKEIKMEFTGAAYDEKYYYMQQYYNEIPVYGRNVILVVGTDLKTDLINSNYRRISKNIDLKASSTKKSINDSIKKYLSLDVSPEIDISSKDLVIYSFDGRDTLAYCLTSGTATIILDADSAEVLYFDEGQAGDKPAIVKGKNSGEEAVGYLTDDGKYQLLNDDEHFALFDYNSVITQLFFSEKNQPILIESNKNTFEDKYVGLMNDIVSVQQFFKNLSFSGFDKLQVCVNYFKDYGTNAYGGGEIKLIQENENGMPVIKPIKSGHLSFGTFFDYSAIDIIAHEYMHGVTRVESKLTKSKSLETSALDEALSDIFGCLYECSVSSADWYMDVSYGDRNIRDPKSTGNYTFYEQIGSNETAGEDKYTISTIISHSAYRMYEGIDEKISASKLAKLWYKSAKSLTAGADFKQCRDVVVAAAAQMTRENELTKKQYSTVVKAFEMAGIVPVSPETAIEVYADSLAWRADLSYMRINSAGHCLIDLDFDGTLEMITSVSAGSGRYSYNKFYRINAQTLTVEKLKYQSEGSYLEFDYYDLRSTYPYLLKNIHDGKKMYYFADYTNAGTADGITFGVTYLKDKVVCEEPRYSESSTGGYSLIFGITPETFYSESTKTDYDKNKANFFSLNQKINFSWGSIDTYEYLSASSSKKKELLSDAYFAFKYEDFEFKHDPLRT